MQATDDDDVVERSVQARNIHGDITF